MSARPTSSRKPLDWGPRLLLLAALFTLAGAGDSSADPKPPPPELKIAVPSAKRTLDGHVQIIGSRIPGILRGVNPIELDHRVNRDRPLVWGAQGPYWDVVRSFMQAASLEVIDTMGRSVILGIGPSDFQMVATSAECLLGFRYRSAPGVFPQVLSFEVVGPCWKDHYNWTVPQVTAEPFAIAGGEQEFSIPDGTRKLGVTWKLITQTEFTNAEFPLASIGVKHAVAGTEGFVTIDGDRRLPNGNRGVSWTPENLDVCEHGLVLDDGSFVTPDAGPGWFYPGEREFRALKSKPVALRLKIATAKVEEPLKLDLDAPQWTSDPRAGNSPLAGGIRLPPAPQGTVVVEMGVIDKLGNSTPSQLTVEFGDAPVATPGTWSSRFSSVALDFHPDGTLGYRVVGLDAGRYTLFMRSGNWIETRKLTLPQPARKQDFLISDADAAELVVKAPEGSAPYLLPDLGEGEDPVVKKVKELRINLEVGAKGEFSAKGLRPGAYELVREGKTKKIQIKKGRSRVDF